LSKIKINKLIDVYVQIKKYHYETYYISFMIYLLLIIDI